MKEVRIFDKSIVMKDNAMLVHRPELFESWDFEKNDALKVCIYKITKNSSRKVFWICAECGEKGYYTCISRIKRKSGCCANGYLKENSLKALFPNIAKEWHPTLNGDLKPSYVFSKSNKKFWFVCGIGHSYNTSLDSRTMKNVGCPFCSNSKILVGFNDMWTTNPDLAVLLLNPNDGYKYSYGSKIAVDWNCLECKTVIKNKKILSILNQGLPCPICKEGMSRPEKIMYSLLDFLDIDFTSQKTFPWSNRRIYDFYLSEYNCIVEMHGRQHSLIGSYSATKECLEKQIQIDKEKRDYAKDNSIDTYIEIPCVKTDFESLRLSILESVFFDVIACNPELVSWEEVFKIHSKSINLKAPNMWKEGFSVKDIATEMNLNRLTVAKILKDYESVGMCEYEKYKGRRSKSKLV